jgi:excisionase family DNA binding protein
MHVADVVPATMTVKEAARLCGISRQYAYVLAARGELPVIKFGGAVRIHRQRLLKMLELEEQITA